MSFALRLSFIAFGVLLALLSLGSLLHDARSKELKEALERFPTLSREAQRQKLGEYRDLIQSPFITEEDFLLLGRAIALHLSQVSEQEERLRLLCEMESTVFQAKQDDRAKAFYLLQYTGLRLQLKGLQCEDRPAEAAEPEKIIDKALSLDPFNPTIVLEVAKQKFILGERKEAEHLAKRFLELKISQVAPATDFLIELFDDGSDLSSILPARFPQLNLWLSYLKSERPDLLYGKDEELTTLLAEALQKSQKRYSDGELPRELYLDQLFRIVDLGLSHETRSRAESYISAFAREENREEVAKFFEEKSSLHPLRFLPAVLPSDTRPLRGSLHSWGKRQSFALDEFYTSFGFFLRPRQSMSLIEIRLPEEFSERSTSELKIYVSEDNSRWIRLDLEREIFRFDNFRSLLFRVSTQYFPYWKIHYPSSKREGSLILQSPNSLALYGVDAERGAP